MPRCSKAMRPAPGWSIVSASCSAPPIFYSIPGAVVLVNYHTQSLGCSGFSSECLDLVSLFQIITFINFKFMHRVFDLTIYNFAIFDYFFGIILLQISYYANLSLHFGKISLNGCSASLRPRERKSDRHRPSRNPRRRCPECQRRSAHCCRQKRCPRWRRPPAEGSPRPPQSLQKRRPRWRAARRAGAVPSPCPGSASGHRWLLRP